MYIPVLYDDTANPSCKQTGFAVFNIMFGNARFQTDSNIYHRHRRNVVGISLCLSSIHRSIQIGKRVLSNGIFAVIHLFKLFEGIELFAEAERF